MYQNTGWSASQIANVLKKFSVEYIQSVIDKFEKNGDQENQN